MLSLQSETSARWLSQIDDHLEELLIDHAHCEKKAAGTAMNLIFAYVENEDLCREMVEIVNEELEHFELVLDLLKRRGIRFRRLTPSSYGRKLNDLVRKNEPQRAVDRPDQQTCPEDGGRAYEYQHQPGRQRHARPALPDHRGSTGGSSIT